MRALNAAYAILSDSGRRAEFDARHYLRRSPGLTVVAPPRARRVAVVEVSQPPTHLQRRVDRIIAVLGVLLLVGIGVYAVTVIPNAEQQLQAQSRPSPPAGRSATASPGSAAGSSTAGQAPSQYVPERLRLDSNLRNFPGAVLVAPAGLEPFASLPILRSEAATQGILRYAVYYGDLTSGSATISGLPGRASFDAGAPHLPDCAPDSAYCVGPVPGQTSGPPGLELFRGTDLVVDDEAFVVHRTCCNGVFWSLSWYEPKTNMSYTIDLSRSAATLFGGTTLDGDRGAAHNMANLASQLVRLP
jgi:hypothetical protein